MYDLYILTILFIYYNIQYLKDSKAMKQKYLSQPFLCPFSCDFLPLADVTWVRVIVARKVLISGVTIMTFQHRE